MVQHALMDGSLSDASSLSMDALAEYESRGHAIYIVTGDGEPMPMPAYRSLVDNAWHLALQGKASDNRTLTDVYSISAVAFAASNFRSNVIAEVPTKVVYKDTDELAEWHPIDEVMTRMSTILWYAEMSQLIWGVCYFRKIYNDFGFPTRLEWMHPEDVRPQVDMDDNVFEYWYLYERLDRDEVVEIRTFDPDRSLNGKSQFEVALSRVTTEQNMVRHAGSFFFNRAVPDGMLVSKLPLDELKRKEAEATFKKFKGSNNSWKTWVGDGSWEWIPITTNPVDLAMVELKGDVKADICMIFATNGVLIGAASLSDPLSAQSTFAGIKRNHIENVTLPAHRYVCEALNEQWLWTDFLDKNAYSLTADRAAMAVLSNVTKENADTVSLVATATNPILDYTEARKIMGLPKREFYIERDPAQAVSLVTNTMATINEGRKLVGLPPFLGFVGEVLRLPSGQLVPTNRFIEVLNKQIDTPPAPSNPFGLSIQHTPPIIPAPMQPVTSPLPLGRSFKLAIIRSTRGDQPGCSVILGLPTDTTVMALQTVAIGQLKDVEIQWTDPATLHLTLLYCDLMTPAQEEALMPLMQNIGETEIQLHGLSTFDKPDTVVLKIDCTPDATIMALQKSLVAAAKTAGCTISEYSLDWAPHITVGYAPVGTEVPVVTTDAVVHPSIIYFSRESFDVYGENLLPIPGSPVMSELPEDRSIRANADVRIIADFSDNMLALQAQRMLAMRLSSLPEPVDEVWPPFQMTLLNLGALSAGDALAVKKGIDPTAYGQVELWADSYQRFGDTIGMTVQPNPEHQSLVDTLASDLDFIGFGDGQPVDAPDNFVPLVQLKPGAVLPDDLLAEGMSFPLVLNVIGLQMGDQVRQRWQLRTYTPQQVKELGDWERKITRRKGAAFEPAALSGTLVEAFIRAKLEQAEADVPTVFADAKALLMRGLEYEREVDPTPEDYATYWSRYDQLQADIGTSFGDYMERSIPAVSDWVSADTAPTSVAEVLAAGHQALQDQWVGTLEEPGDLTKLILAGMAAGNEVLLRQVNSNPARAATRATDTAALTISWELLSQQALDYARSYSFGLIKGLDATTTELVRAAFEDWIQSGEPLAALRNRLTIIFGDRKRAQLIAQTESIRVYNEGAFTRWKTVGVTRATWQTVKDTHVCPICVPLQGQVAAIDAGWVHPGGTVTVNGKAINTDNLRGRIQRESAHPGCRCFRKPYIENVKFIERPLAA